MLWPFLKDRRSQDHPEGQPQKGRQEKKSALETRLIDRYYESGKLGEGPIVLYLEFETPEESRAFVLAVGQRAACSSSESHSCVFEIPPTVPVQKLCAR